MSKNIKDRSKTEGQQSYNRYLVWGVLLAVLLLTAAIRIRLLEIPLERDEGEYAYGGRLILQGLPSDAPLYNIKPGIYTAYALILAVFGQTHTGIHLGLLVINAATVFVLFFLAKRLFDPVTALAAAAAFAILSLGQRVLGFTANREHFVILPALGGILLVLRAIDCRRWLSLLAGALLLGISFIMKPNGLIFIVFAGLWLLFCEIRRRPFNWKVFLGKGVLFTCGVLLPFALLCLILWQLGIFRMFWFWRVEYVSQYATALPLTVGLGVLKKWIISIAGSAILVWILAGVGLIAVFLNRKTRPRSLFVAGFLLFSFLAICPGFYFRPHYFILLLPAIALLAGLSVNCIYNFLTPGQSVLAAKLKPVLLVLIVLLYPLYQQRNYFFVVSPTILSRTTYLGNPFVESLEIARFIRENSTKDDCIAVIGSEPQIYFYADRHSATGHMYTYPLMGKYDFALELQKQMIREIESARPKFLVFVNIRTSWLVRRSSEKLIFRWFRQYQKEYYRRVGVVDILSRARSVYRWHDRAVGYTPLSNYWLTVFQRRSYDQ
jgi:hypothetical protein